MENYKHKLQLPVIIILAVNMSVLGEAGEFGVEGELAVGALEAVDVPRFLDGQQVVAVDDLAAAAGARARLRLRAAAATDAADAVDHRHALQKDKQRSSTKTARTQTHRNGVTEVVAKNEHERCHLLNESEQNFGWPRVGRCSGGLGKAQVQG